MGCLMIILFFISPSLFFTVLFVYLLWSAFKKILG